MEYNEEPYKLCLDSRARIGWSIENATIINSLVGPYQFSFIKGRQILDGALVVGDIIDSCKTNRKKALLLKLDFH